MSEIRITAQDCPRAPIDKFVPYANNARTHSPEQIKRLQAAYRRTNKTSRGLITPSAFTSPRRIGGASCTAQAHRWRW